MLQQPALRARSCIPCTWCGTWYEILLPAVGLGNRAQGIAPPLTSGKRLKGSGLAVDMISISTYVARRGEK